MDDKELTELAAKAIGKTIRYNYLGSQDANYAWYPLDDDADAFCLAVDLNIGHDCYVDEKLVEHCAAWVNHRSVPKFLRAYEPYENNARAATRRAIVRIAAELGKAVP